ncbi:MAG: hypothetical protein ACI4SG_09365 [Oligosphaeraceae bacterium]
MSPKSFLLLALVLLLVAVPVGCRYLRSDTRTIRKQLTAICQDVEKKPEEGNTVTALKMITLGNRLDARVEIRVHDIPVTGNLSAEELTSQVNRARLYMDTIHLELLDDVITVDGEAAVADCVIYVKALSAQRSYKFEDTFHLRIQLHKNQDGKWLFSSFQEGPLLQK